MPKGFAKEIEAQLRELEILKSADERVRGELARFLKEKPKASSAGASAVLPLHLSGPEALVDALHSPELQTEARELINEFEALRDRKWEAQNRIDLLRARQSVFDAHRSEVLGTIGRYSFLILVAAYLRI